MARSISDLEGYWFEAMAITAVRCLGRPVHHFTACWSISSYGGLPFPTEAI